MTPRPRPSHRWARLALPVALLVCGAWADEACGQAGTVQSGAATDVASRFLGGWILVDWRAEGRGGVRFPYGENVQGQIVYTPDGRMSAHLMNPPQDPDDAPSQYLGYWGRFTVDEAAGTVTHHVEGSDAEGWIGSEQVRGYEFMGDGSLVLSLGSNRLTWVRAR